MPLNPSLTPARCSMRYESKATCCEQESAHLRAACASVAAPPPVASPHRPGMAAAVVLAWQKSKRYTCMEERVAANPLDAEAWTLMIGEAQQQSPNDYRDVFEECLKHFPDSGYCWRLWIEAEIRAGDLQQVEKIFERCLIRCPHLQLWMLYLRYLKFEKQTPAADLTQAIQVLLQAVGDDVGSGPIWIDYIMLCRNEVEPGMMQQGMQAVNVHSAPSFT